MPPSQPDTPLHPLLPGHGGGSSGIPSAHLQQHAASAGPSEGARGALWFVVVLALIVVGAIVALALLLVTTGGEIIDEVVTGAADDPQDSIVDEGPPVGPDQLLLDSIGELLDSTSSQAFVFRLDQRRIVRIDVTSRGGLDPVVTLLDEGGQQIARDDDGGDGLDSLLELELEPGTYRIEVEGFGSSTGEFRVTAFTR